MKYIGIVLLLIGLLVLGCDIYQAIYGSYEYEKNFNSYWLLAEKASSIKQKSEYVDKFVHVIGLSNMSGQHNAIFMDTPDNSFDENFKALQSLQIRLTQIDTMDVGSFQYQTAIQQITAQEQGEAHQMLGVFSGIWWKGNHFWLWEWVGVLQILTMVIFVIGGVLLTLNDY